MTASPQPSRYAQALPNPDRRPDFYAGVPARRAIAFVIDSVAALILTVFALPFTLFAGVLFFPMLWLAISFFYRWISIALFSATPGMLFCGVELREADGLPMRSGTGFWHTMGYTISMAVFPLQLISVALMLTTARKQGLSDHLLGTAAINRPAR